MARTVVVGAAIAGVTLAQSLRELGEDDEIVLVDAGLGTPYQRPPLSKQVLAGADPGCADLLAPDALARQRIELRTGWRAHVLDVRGRRLLGRDVAGHDHDRTGIGYDRLVLACGARAVVPAHLRAAVAAGAHLLRTREQAVALADAMGAGGSAVVLGGGVLGSEIAAAAAARGLGTTLVARAGLSVGPLRGRWSAPAHALHHRHGVRVLTGRAVQQVCGGAGGWDVALDDGARLRPDLLVLALGAAPDLDWLTGALPLGAGGVRCGPHGRVAPGVWAVGDVADRADARDEVARMTQAGAVVQARAVAAAMVGDAAPDHVQPYFWSDLHGVRVQAAGRIPPGAEVVPLERDDEGGLRTGVVTRSGLAVGAVAWGSPRGFRSARALIGAAVAELEPVA